MLEAKLRRAEAGSSEDPDEDDPVESFRSQYLNVWPMRRLVKSHRSEPLVDVDEWLQAADLFAEIPAGRPVTVAIEDYFGLGAAAAAAAQLDDGRLLVWGALFPNRAEAYAWSSFTIAAAADSRALIGASLPLLEAKAQLGETPVDQVGTTQTYQALPMLRHLIRAKRLVHSGDDDLERQVRTVRVVPSSSGGLAPAHRGIRSDLLRAVAWSAADRATAAEPLEFYVY
jgi:hypothetical protein